MRGNPSVIATRADLDLAREKSPAEYAAFIVALKGSLISTADTQTYPADYDHTLKEGGTGFLPPLITQVESLSTIERFGFTRDEVLSL